MPADPPFVSHLLFEQPLGSAAAVLVLAALLTAIAMRRGSRPMLIFALVGGPVLAVGLWALAANVTTGREQVMSLTRQLVSATSPLDASAIDRLLDPQVVMVGPGGGAWLTRSEFDPIMRRVLQRFSILRNTARVLGAEMVNANGARVVMDVTTRLDSKLYGDRPIQTRWLIEWIRWPEGPTGPPGPWRALRIHWLEHPAPNGVQPQRGVWS